jgi:hypothetical protein
MSSPWTHSICETCWRLRHPDNQPVRIREEYRDESPERCCFCARKHGSGIYVRNDPKELLCNGNHLEKEVQ